MGWSTESILDYVVIYNDVLVDAIVIKLPRKDRWLMNDTFRLTKKELGVEGKRAVERLSVEIGRWLATERFSEEEARELVDEVATQLTVVRPLLGKTFKLVNGL